jgi:hypothetical protein
VSLKGPEDLLAMPKAFEKRREAWQRITTGNAVLRGLRSAVRGGSIDRVERLLEEWQEFLEVEGETYQTQRTMLRAAVVCARIAALNCQARAELPALLRRFNPAAELPDGQVGLAPPSVDSEWRQLVRCGLLAMRWRPPLCTGWALDVLGWMRDGSRRAARSQSVWALLAVNYGVPARLTVELLEDLSSGDFYPDPATMMFVVRDDAFQQAEQTAVSLVRAEGLWPAGGVADVRWRIERLDGKLLAGIKGGSAGGAFALALAKLFAGG